MKTAEEWASGVMFGKDAKTPENMPEMIELHYKSLVRDFKQARNDALEEAAVWFETMIETNQVGTWIKGPPQENLGTNQRSAAKAIRALKKKD